MPKTLLLLMLSSIALWLGCHSSNSEKQSSPSTDSMIVENKPIALDRDQKGRLAWQKPSMVINKLGDLTGKTVADIGAGTGYFTFRFMRYAKKVIAIDIDGEMIELIEVFRENLDSLDQLKIETRLAAPDDPRLWPEEVDVIVLINTIAYIQDRAAYLATLKKALKPRGILMIVDFKLKRIPGTIAPPVDNRVGILELEDALVKGGYRNVKTDDTSLDFQYIILADKD